MPVLRPGRRSLARRGAMMDNAGLFRILETHERPALILVLSRPYDELSARQREHVFAAVAEDVASEGQDAESEDYVVDGRILPEGVEESEDESLSRVYWAPLNE